MPDCCPTCHRPYPKPRTAKPQDHDLTSDEVNALSDAALHAYYKRIAPRKDVEFFLSHCTDGDLRLRAEALLTAIRAQSGKHSGATKAEYLSLHQAWRRARNADDPAFGAARHEVTAEVIWPVEGV